MKSLLLIALFSFSTISCNGQKMIKEHIIGPIAYSNSMYTSDSVIYYIEYNRKPANGPYTIYQVEKSPVFRGSDDDQISSPITVLTDFYSEGAFTKGRKTGLWLYYNGDKKLREETYQNGRRVSVRKCPCK